MCEMFLHGESTGYTVHALPPVVGITCTPPYCHLQYHLIPQDLEGQMYLLGHDLILQSIPLKMNIAFSCVESSEMTFDC